MSKSYYAAIYQRKKCKPYELVEVVRYHSDSMTSGEVKAARDSDVKLYDYGSAHWVAVKAKDVPKLLRKLYNLEPYERFYGEIKFCQQFDGGSGWCCATVPDYICHG